MKIRALFAIVAIALCMTVAVGSATASGATATLTNNGGLTGALHISGAPSGAYTVLELTDTGYVLVGSGVVGSSGSSDAVVTLLPAANPSFQVRLRSGDGIIILSVDSPGHEWWWD